MRASTDTFQIWCSIHCKRMSLLNVELYVFINVFYIVLFYIHVCVDDVIEKKDSWKIENGLFCSALFYMKTIVYLKYFVDN